MNNLLAGSFRRYSDLKKESFKDIELGQGEVVTNTDKQLARFFEEVDDVKEGMEKIKNLLAKLKQTNAESLTVHKAGTLNALRQRMDKDIEQVLKFAKVIKGQLEELDKKNLASRSLIGCSEGTPTDRTRTSMTATLRKNLKDLMGEFQILREKIMSDYKETVQRRYYTVTGEQPDDQTVDRIIETGESENFLQQAIQEQGRGQVIETIREIQERHDAVKDIEKNLMELHQIFLDMSVLVEAQGEQLNSIEAAVLRASSFVQTGTAQLVVAKKHQRSSRKWVCIGIIILLVVIAIIVVPIVISLNKK